MINDTDLRHLRRCIELAEAALEKGDEPFGSILVTASGEVLAEDHNHVAGGDHTQHPEFALARWAAQNMTLEERAQATVYTSGEHCPMCAAAHGWVGLGRIVLRAPPRSWRNGWARWEFLRRASGICRYRTSFGTRPSTGPCRNSPIKSGSCIAGFMRQSGSRSVLR
ncbi:cytidine/deoxycytidylate deaminase-like protein [Fontibacillus phaseoli]|uniref:Cytidine/deoxycytidylate deaminase-like protein n=1 Tax=Fontibacillus phaseoli TaxID=1416533 RepID=A0A369BAS2_9BACL|nr:cytidine/deoxycytidylate deaminase-like protein [Fontibacillus phaseoli]